MTRNSITIIKPKKTLDSTYFKEIWDYKELLYFFSWRDFKIRYKQTIIGILWVIFQPLITMIIFSIFFGKFLELPSDGIPYPIFVYVGLLFWQFFSSTISDISNIFITNQSLITKIYFPKLILPISTILNKTIDFIITSFILIGMMFYYKYIPSLNIIFILPLLFIITCISSMGFGLILASINVKYRDVKYILPFFIQLLLFVTPVIYPISIAEKYTWILSLNPMTGIIQTARDILFNTNSINLKLLIFSIATSVVLLFVGMYTLKKTETNFADIV